MAFNQCYFTCSANLYGINACPIHGCRLVKTELSTDSKKTPAFITAEEIIPFKNDVVQKTNPIEIGVVRYIIELFQAPFIDVETAPVAEASRDAGCFPELISAHLHGRIATAKGKHWKFVEIDNDNDGKKNGHLK